MYLRVLCGAIVVVTLTGCNTPSPAFLGEEVATVTIEGSTFAVRQSGARAELIRTNQEAVFSLRQIIPRASKAVQVATGCDPLPETWTGDQAVMRVDIDCAG